jgi:hypothetical protein
VSQPEPERDPGDRLAAIAAELLHIVRELEDVRDAWDADAAWEEAGESIPLADLEAEFTQG